MDNNLNIKTVHICRTCTEEIINTSFFYLDFTQIDSEPTIGQKLSNCIPELDLSIVPNTVICGKCADTITSLYIFKKECLQFEMQIREYIQQVHHTDNVIDLAAVMQFHQLHSKDFTTQLTTEAFEKIETETENYKIEELTTSFCDNYAVNETEENTATGVFVKMENYTNEESTSSYDYYAVNKTESDLEITSTSPDTVEKATTATNNLLPQKSRKVYEKYYKQYMDWRYKNNITSSYSENELVVYFEELSTKMKSPSLWTYYSTLKSTLNLKHQIDIAKYPKLYALLKQKSEGYKGKKSKTFSPEEVKTFINEAPEDTYLMTKVALIFGIMGACRRHELHDLKINNVKDLNSTLLVTIQDAKTKIRKFTITGRYYDICKKYMDLRPETCYSPSFFINYCKGKCTVQNVGINKFGNMGKQIATYLNLPDPHLYTGHCFRRSSATILVDAGGDITTLKRHGGWRSTTVAVSYMDDSDDDF